MKLQAMRPWIILALIFLLGGVTGSLLTIAFGPHPDLPGPQQMSKHWMDHLTERLKLTDDQQQKIRPIVMDAENQIQTAHHDDVSRIGKIMEETHTKIAEQLHPDQQDALKEMEKERERNFFRHMHGGHGPGDFQPPGDGDHPPPPQGGPTPTS